MTTRCLLPILLIIAAACGGAGENDPDRTSLSAREPHDVMWNDTSVLPTAMHAIGGVAQRMVPRYSRVAQSVINRLGRGCQVPIRP